MLLAAPSVSLFSPSLTLPGYIVDSNTNDSRIVQTVEESPTLRTSKQLHTVRTTTLG